MDFADTHYALVVLEQVIDSIQEAVCVIDEAGRVRIWNRNAEKLYGLSREKISGRYLGEFFPNAIDLKVLESKEPVKNVYHSPRDGTHIIISAAPIFVGSRCVGVVSTDKDVSDMQRVSEELRRATEMVTFLEEQLARLTAVNWGNIIGKSKRFQDTMEIARRAAKSRAAILITGESGTGKEVFARAIHDQSGLKGPFVPVNCSAIPPELFESEFFGYEAGAFTGASRRGKAGFFEMAQGGTLFLDEIGDLPMFMQSKLLRVLEEKRLKKVGGEKYIDVSVRIVSATNRNLSAMVQEGKFRDDLFYRLNVIHLELPPLRERPEDIVPLLQFFLQRACAENAKAVRSIDSQAVKILTRYGWKGNIRELKNVVENMVVLCQGNVISKEDIPEYILSAVEEHKTKGVETQGLEPAVKDFERKMILKALKKTAGNIAQAARLLEIPRSTLHYKLEQHQINVNDST